MTSIDKNKITRVVFYFLICNFVDVYKYELSVKICDLAMETEHMEPVIYTFCYFVHFMKAVSVQAIRLKLVIRFLLENHDLNKLSS